MKRILFTYLLTFVATVTAFATHNRAGEITYKYLSGKNYEITVTTYTKTSSVQADRCELTVLFGDGDSAIVERINGPVGSCPHMGEQLPNDVKKNVYVTTHTYPGPGEYIIKMEDPNRNEGILNMPNSVNQSFALRSTLIIGTFTGQNSSPVLTNPPIDMGCTFVPFLHNPGAIDPDGDSLYYYLTKCLGTNFQVINGYVFPDEVNSQGGLHFIDPNVGTYTWDSPSIQGQYNIAIVIEEWRKINGIAVKIGQVLRDMQFDIGPCSHEPPTLEECEPLCVLAGDTIDSLDIVATDPDGDIITLTATGDPLTVSPSPGFFTQNVSGQDTVVGKFYWETVCDHIRSQPYYLTIKAEDNNPEISLVDFKTLSITVVGPPPTNLQATPAGTSINLTWDPTTCGNAEGYKIYRRNGPYQDSLECPCETGVPAGAYELIGTTSGINSTTFTDSNNGAGLVHGQNYCYRVVACFPGGALSCASDEVCEQLILDVPVIVNVSVNSTDITTGSDTVKWLWPRELDTINQWNPPYYYKVYRGNGFTGATELVHTTPSNNFLPAVDTFFVSEPINTEDSPHVYLVELYATGNQPDELVGSASEASSIYLSSVPSDDQLSLTWTEDVPWTNYAYEVYRYNTTSTLFELLDTAYQQSYIDTGLTNGIEYCYYVKSIGTYSTQGFPDPLFNNSQEHCNIPIDLTPPCPPVIEIEANCDLIENFLNWTNPNNSCADDVAGYKLYYSPRLGEPYTEIYSNNSPNDTTYLDQKAISIAGCYAVTAIDSSGNESEFSNIVCVDNCPEYELPNVFTPGSDGFNDFFGPFPYKFIDSIDLTIWNRWGQIVFTTQNPDINWDGTNQTSQEPVTDGVYYYVCDVNEIRLAGIETRTLTGYITLLREKNTTPPGN